MTSIKVEPAIAREDQDVQAIRVAPSKVLMKEVDSSRERGEKPRLRVKSEFSKTRKVVEISFVFMGDYHVEDITYATKDPATWVTFGEIYTTPTQALQLAEKIKRVVKAAAKEPTQTQLQEVLKMRFHLVTREQLERVMRQSFTAERSTWAEARASPGVKMRRRRRRRR